jgi:Na+/citrate or Na+/malate symporter
MSKQAALFLCLGVALVLLVEIIATFHLWFFLIPTGIVLGLIVLIWFRSTSKHVPSSNVEQKKSSPEVSGPASIPVIENADE